MFVGANEGFDLPGAGGPIRCCGADWAAAWAFRARSMIETYRQGGRARVYWLTVPAPRDSGRARISRAVNAAIGVAAEPYRAQARVLDMAALFTPGFRYRDAMDVDGRRALVREPDGIHLNARGAAVAADAVSRRCGATSRSGELGVAVRDLLRPLRAGHVGVVGGAGSR